MVVRLRPRWGGAGAGAGELGDTQGVSGERAPVDPGDGSADVRVDGRRGPLSHRQWRWLVGILIVAAVLRLAWLVATVAEPPFALGGDQNMYWYHGAEIAAGRGYHVPGSTDPTAYYPIGYPAILALLTGTFSNVPVLEDHLIVVVTTFHAAISVATVALTFLVGRRLLGVRAGLVAAAVMAAFPNTVYQVTSLQLETTFVFLAMAALAVIVDHDWSAGPPSRNRLLAFGAVLSASAIVRPFSVPLLLGVLLALLAIGVGRRRALLATAVPVGVLVVAFTPWTIRNAVQMDAFVPSSTNMGDTLCIDRNDAAEGGFRWSAHAGCVDPEMSEVERNTGNTRKAIEFVVDDPGRELTQIVRRARLIFSEDNDGIRVAERRNPYTTYVPFRVAVAGDGPPLSEPVRSFFAGLGDWYFRAVLVVAAAGLPLLVRRSPRPERRLVLTMAGALLVIPLLLWGNPRFHLPLVPFMALAAAALTTWTWTTSVARARAAVRTSPDRAPAGEAEGAA